MPELCVSLSDLAAVFNVSGFGMVIMIGSNKGLEVGRSGRLAARNSVVDVSALSGCCLTSSDGDGFFVLSEGETVAFAEGSGCGLVDDSVSGVGIASVLGMGVGVLPVPFQPPARATVRLHFCFNIDRLAEGSGVVSGVASTLAGGVVISGEGVATVASDLVETGVAVRSGGGVGVGSGFFSVSGVGADSITLAIVSAGRDGSGFRPTLASSPSVFPFNFL